MPSMTTLSVVIPCYNERNTIERVVHSVRDAPVAGLEIIVVDDLSTDGTPSVNGTVSGSSIRFGTVGSSAITYTGTVSGNSMSGSYQTPGGGGSWSAHKTS